MAFSYMPGFGNDFETETLPGSLPQGRNSPQRPAYGLYAEQLSGSPFTAPRGTNERSWLYRIRPSVRHTGPLQGGELSAVEKRAECRRPRTGAWPVPLEPGADAERADRLHRRHAHDDDGRRRARPDRHGRACLCRQPLDGRRPFLQRRRRIAGRAAGRRRCASSPRWASSNSRRARSAVLPRGLVFKVELVDGPVRGYVCENYGAKLTLPDRGPIGANCLANPRDFKTPCAWFEDKETPCRLIVKWCGKFHVTELGHSPLDVVAWHGNYAPYKYDLATFSPVGAILFDHPDPSIFTVLTAPSGRGGHRQYRLRHLPAALAGGRKHVPPALVSPQHHERVHGPDPRPVRRQGRGFRARRHQPAQYDAGARAGRARLRKGLDGRAEAGQARQHHGLHVRDALSADADPLRRRGWKPGRTITSTAGPT